MFTVLKRIIKIGLKTFWRNGLLSSASILTVTITLVSTTFLYFGILISEYTLKKIEDKIDINIYFEIGADKNKVEEFKKEIFKIDGVDKNRSKFLSQDEVYQDFIKQTGDEELLAEVTNILGEKPVGPVLNIKAKSLGDYKKISKYLESEVVQTKYNDILNNTNYNDNQLVAKRIEVWTKYLEIIGAISLGVLLFISLVLIYNTIRIIIYSYKEEIQVMRLIGASNFYARGPFLVEGILYGFISGVLSVIIIYTTLYFTRDFFGELTSFSLYDYFNQNIIQLSGIIIISAIIISFISTYFAVSKYLNVEH